MNKTSFGKTHTGEEVSLYEITNDKGMKVLVTDFGATVVSIFVNDKDGNKRDVVLGYDDVSAYEKETCYFGATVGRYANRISDAKINIDGTEYVLEANDNENNLHSGSHGTSGRIWNVKEYKDNEITFTIEDKDLEQGYPGNAVMNVTYTVTEDNELAISYNAKADKTTTFNMTNHSYFNLNGHKSGKVYSQILQIKKSQCSGNLLHFRINGIKIMKRQFILDSSKLFHQRIHLIWICCSQFVADLVHALFFFQKRIKGRFQHLPDGHTFFQDCMLIQIACVDIFCPFYLTFIWHQFSGYNTHKCGLSFTVGTDKSDMFSLQEPERYVLKNRSVSKSVSEMFNV